MSTKIDRLRNKLGTRWDRANSRFSTLIDLAAFDRNSRPSQEVIHKVCAEITYCMHGTSRLRGKR